MTDVYEWWRFIDSIIDGPDLDIFLYLRLFFFIISERIYSKGASCDLQM